MEAWREGGRRPSQRHLRERTTEGGAEGAGPSKLINEINLSAIFGGKVGKGKRGRRAGRTWNKSGALRSQCKMFYATIYTSMSSNLKIGYRLR